MTNQNRIIYTLVFLLSLTVFGFLLYGGNSIEKTKPTIQTESIGPLFFLIEDFSLDTIYSDLLKNADHPLSKTLLLIILILFISRLIGLFFRRIGQPTVLGEIIAGVLIGPSVLGILFPGFHEFLFIGSQSIILSSLSELGLILFMFVIGMQIDFVFVFKKSQSIKLVSHSLIFIPFISGVFLAYLYYNELAPVNVGFFEYSLFIGISITITAYPLLARILNEKGLSNSNLGHTALSTSAFGNIVVWFLLSILIILIKSSSLSSIFLTISLAILYTLMMIFVIHPFLRRLSEIYVSRENLTKSAMAIVFLTLFSSAYLTDLIGLHALIGAFFAGVIMPSDQKLKDLISERVDYIALVFLLPLFFASMGLNTDLTAFKNQSSIILLCFVTAISILSKFSAASLSSRAMGMSWRDSLSLGTLMNTRGIMELIVINIGFQLGIIDSVLYSALVVMTIITTLITKPSLKYIQSNFFDDDSKQPLEAFRKILISFGQASMGVALIKLADFLFSSYRDKTQLTAIHITPTEILSPEEEAEYKKKSFSDIEDLMSNLNLNLEMVHKTTENVTYEILNQAKKTNSRFLLIGAAKSLFTKNILGGKIRSILNYAPCNVGVLLDNGLDRIKKVLILKKTNNSLGFEKLTYYLQKIHGRMLKQMTVSQFTTLKHEDFKDYQLVLIELELWKEREEFLEIELLNLSSSFLIIQFK
ncbi:MAG: cation:proton antiporter [Leptospira sp.]|nr:cation:proton antiporter [Leptospira sp.]